MYNTHINFIGIEKHYSDKQVLHGANLEIQSGQCVLLCGNNGSGKTTFLRIIAGLEVPDAGFVNTGLGKYTWKKCRSQLRQTVVYLHQQPYMFDGTVTSNLNFSLHDKVSYPRRRKRIKSAIKWAGLENIAENSAKTLSGGERQRVAITRAWLRDPEILLLDEPITNMDHDSRVRTMALLHNLKQQGVALVVSSHEPVHFDALTDIWLQLSDGRLHDFNFGDSDNVRPIHYRRQRHEHSK